MRLICGILGTLTLAISAGGMSAAADLSGPADEVWVTEQNRDAVVIFDARTMAKSQSISTAGLLTRPHVVVFTNDYRFAFVVGTLSDNIGIYDAATRQLLQTFSTLPGKSPHAIFPTPDDSRAFAVGIGTTNQFVLELVRADNPVAPFARGRFLDLSARDRLISDDPSVQALARDPARIPNLRAVCPGYTADSKDLYVTLNGGGLIIFDIPEFPKIRKAFDRTQIPPTGCGLILNRDGKKLYVNSGDSQGSSFQVFDVTPEDRRGSGLGRVKNLLVKSVNADAKCQALGARCRDLHSLHFNATGDRLWMYSRIDNTAALIDTSCRAPATCDEIVEVVRFGPAFDRPDLSIVSRDGTLAYVTLRGPKPAPTAAHPIAGKNPGVAVIEIEQRKLQGVVSLGDPSCDPSDPANRGCDDPHGIAVRLNPPPFPSDLSRKTGGM